MDVRYVSAGRLEEHRPGDVLALLDRTDGFVWIDVPSWDADAESVLVEILGCHPRVVEACQRRNHVPTMHVYERHAFVTLHAPLLGTAGHVHLLELDQLLGRSYLVTIHGPINPRVDPAMALVETRGVLRRIEEGRFAPKTPGEASYAISTAIARSQRALVSHVAERVPALEQQVMEGDFRRPEDLLEEMFLLRHELLTARTMAAQSHDVQARLTAIELAVPDPERWWSRDLADQFDRVRSIADGELSFVFGVIDLYQTRVNTKMTVAMERLAVIAAVTLPVTAIASVLGMNVIVFGSIQWFSLALALLLMGVISGLLLRWARRQGWW